MSLSRTISGYILIVFGYVFLSIGESEPKSLPLLAVAAFLLTVAFILFLSNLTKGFKQ